MAARRKVFLRLPGSDGVVARTDLAGRGNVSAGEEFVARELFPNGRGLTGRAYRVRVLRVERVRRGHHVLHVEVLADLTPSPATEEQRK